MARRPRKTVKKHYSFDPTLSRGIIAVVLAILAAIITLSFFNKAGAVGVALDDWILAALLGRIRYTAPFIILVLAWFLVRDIDYDYRPTHAIGAFLFFLSLAGIFHLPLAPEDMWREAINGGGGGIFGMLAWPLKRYLGVVASAPILAGLVIVSTLLIFNTSIAHFILLHKKLFESLGSLGRMTVAGVKKLFAKKDAQNFSISGEYSERGDSDEDEEEEPAGRRGFFRKNIGGAQDEDEANAQDEQDEEEGDDTDEKNEGGQKQKTTPSDVWSKKVIVKKVPPLELLSNKRGKPTSGDIKANAEIIKGTLAEFGIDVDMGEVRVGPTVTQYSLKPAKGVKLARITGLANDLALALAAHPIRIEAPIPGKSLVGIEVPNQKTALVTFRELLETREFSARPHSLMLALGKDVAGKTWFADLPRMPHLLIAGATGSGKTVCINSIIMSLLYQNTAETLRMIMVDPKRVELTLYNGIPHLLTPVITNTQQTINALKWTTQEMDRRFELLSGAGSRDISSYNQKHPKTPIPHIVFIVDELADLMATAANEVEAGIIRIAQMARAVGIHLVLATQRPSVDVITGLMKANIPARIAFSVASLIDSRTILDSPGAEKLLGRGDMLFLTAELSKPVRIQNAFISEDEAKQVVEYLKGDEEPEYDETIIQKPGAAGGGTMSLFGGPSDDRDPLFEEAKEAIIQAGKASASLLQRRMKVGYARAARILDEMEEAGIIGPADGAKPREILMTDDARFDTTDAGREHNVFDEDTQEDESST